MLHTFHNPPLLPQQIHTLPLDAYRNIIPTVSHITILARHDLNSARACFERTLNMPGEFNRLVHDVTDVVSLLNVFHKPQDIARIMQRTPTNFLEQPADYVFLENTANQLAMRNGSITAPIFNFMNDARELNPNTGHHNLAP